MLHAPSKVSSNLFDFHKENLYFSSEFSMLPKSFRLAQVYDDACDVGFTIVSAKTGGIAVFTLKEENYDGEGDLTHMDFVCVTPGLKHLKAVIFND